MRKLGVVLALLVLGSLLTVGTGTVREVEASTSYYIVVDGYTEQMILDALNGITWWYYTPQYNVTGNVITFPTLKDMLRFLAFPDFRPSSAPLPVSKIKTSIPIKQVVLVTEDGHGTGDVYEKATFTADNVYIWAKVSWEGSGAYPIKAWLTYEGTTLLAADSGSADKYAYYENYTINGTITLHQNDPYGPSVGRWSGVSIFLLYDSSRVPVDLSESGVTDAGYYKEITYQSAVAYVTFSLKDGLTGQPLSGVTVKEGSTVLGTIDDGGSLELTKGQHTLTFEKSGYWSVTKTIDVQSDMTVSVEMYPDSAAFKLENFPANISIPENTIYELTFTLSPIQTSATYNTYLAISGLSDVLEVRKDSSVISPENGKYYLGDISGPTQVSIKFKAGAVGTHGFTITLTSNDAIMSKTYTTTKQVTYKVEPLPFSVQMPSEWQVGMNELRISESSGQSYLITAVLKDGQGNEVWSDSHAFSPYEAHTFTVNVPSEGQYTLELQWNGQTAVYDITVNPAITLKTKTLTVSKGGEGTIVLHFKNPSSSVQYYTIKVSGGFLPKEINQSISVAPLTEKDVSIAFAVPDNLQYDAYELNVQVLQGNATVFSDKVAVSISDSSGFSLFGGTSSGGKTLYYSLAALVGLGLFIAILRRR
ncbi:hypothetical protein [Thermococcus sp.]|uniref:hypothetical protein n=3 Tax=Thermococcus sp. TaxID=35749 RepID=UPI002637B834|nr:hypothetical protein [Thermococcus sp.]